MASFNCALAYQTATAAKITPTIPTTREAISPVLKPFSPDELGTRFESLVVVRGGDGEEDVASLVKEEEEEEEGAMFDTAVIAV